MSTVTTGAGEGFLARRSVLVGGVTLALAAAAGARLGWAASKPTITVHKSPT